MPDRDLLRKTNKTSRLAGTQDGGKCIEHLCTATSNGDAKGADRLANKSAPVDSGDILGRDPIILCGIEKAYKCLSTSSNRRYER